MFAATLLCQVLLATAAFAVPTSKERFAQRAARRAAGFSHQSQPKTLSQGSAQANLITNNSHVDYSPNWGGAVLVANTATYTSVTGTFVVPTPSEPSGESGSHSASAWVGIDGDTCQTAILQTGLDFTVSGSSVTYDAWYEWYPDYAHDFSDISFSAGDTVTVSVTATSLSDGTATITNESTGQTVSHTFSGQPSLCEYNAEWIVEDFESGGSLVPFANFGTVTFTDASAKTTSGSTVGPSGSTIINIEQNNKVLTSVSTASDSVAVSYVG
ncbi:aspergillopepsin [Lentinus tigrinus ALCF2SS1-7]|uniref:Aspergillopepsin n=1 Tax=Lentinus tigrinus ALCF2SS1-6 TaxID=1328759 RepID=A0A5C2RVE0_9APHY|nr:aspergillopepsin [Lentinus tigrinus ALCF2SS1-6]RPD70104.1 aspergillopepsin [Lentinus tigrinus ALCF2SS1-7]